MHSAFSSRLEVVRRALADVLATSVVHVSPHRGQQVMSAHQSSSFWIALRLPEAFSLQLQIRGYMAAAPLREGVHAGQDAEG